MAVIYKIENKINGKLYIGQTINFNKRKNTHCRELKTNSHKNKHLQGAWNKYGESAFEFSILEEVSDETPIYEREQYWIDKYQYTGLLYNLFLIAVNGKPKNIYVKELGKKLPQNFYNKELGVKNANEGKPRAEETKRKIGEAQLGELNHMYGKTHSKEAKKKIGEASALNKVKSYPSFTAPDGTVYPSGVSFKEFCLRFGHDTESNFYKGLTAVKNKKRKSYFGWILT